MQRVRKLVSAPDDIPGGQAKVTIAVLDTGERVTVLQMSSVPVRTLRRLLRYDSPDLRCILIDIWGKSLYNK